MIKVYPLPSSEMEADFRVEWGQLVDLLLTREDLLQRYFSAAEPTDADIEEMIAKFMREDDKASVVPNKKHSFKGRVNSCMNDELWEYLAQSISAMKKPIFKRAISGPPLRDFLSGTLDYTLKAASNSRLSFWPTC